MKLVAALLTVYVVWGSTYLAIAVADRSLPPLLMLSVRFLVAGAVLFAWKRQRPTSTRGSDLADSYRGYGHLGRRSVRGLVPRARPPDTSAPLTETAAALVPLATTRPEALAGLTRFHRARVLGGIGFSMLTLAACFLVARRLTNASWPLEGSSIPLAAAAGGASATCGKQHKAGDG